MIRDRVFSLAIMLTISGSFLACNQAKFSADGRSKGAENSKKTEPTQVPDQGTTGPNTNLNPNPSDPKDPGANPAGNSPSTPNISITDPANPPSGSANTPVDVAKNPPVPGTPSNTVLPKPGTSEAPVLKEVRVVCSTGYDSSVATIDYRAPKSQKVSMQVRGEFCPQSTEKLSVLLAVDYSASMGKHIFDKTNTVSDGSDPLVNGSCGRLRAVQAIVKKLKDSAKGSDAISVAILPFASKALTSAGTKSAFIALSSIDSYVNQENFCRYISQGAEYNTPGALSQGETGSAPGTNYADVFAKSQSILSRVSGQKLMYFISDGEPTEPTASPVESAVQAGTLLRSSISNLTMNSLLLKSRDASAIDILNRVTGSADRVKLAENADQLAAMIVDFKPAAIDERFGNANIYAAPYPEQALNLVSISKTSEKVWSYLTQPFLLQGIQGQMVQNRVTVLAKGTDGSQHSSVITIRYTQD